MSSKYFASMSTMLNKNIHLGITTASVTTFTLIAGIVPSYAADFRLSFDDFPQRIIGQLSFTQSSLTGRGFESATLSDLKDAQFFFSYPSIEIPQDPFTGETFIYGFNSNSPASFKFDNGKLVGANFTASASQQGGFSTGGSNGAGYNVTGTVNVTGDTYAEILNKGYVTYSTYDPDNPACLNNPDPNCAFSTNTVNFDNTLVNSGKVTFITITPITSAVPEPLTILGSITALGLGVSLKRKIRK
jgi:hypothetical protein